MKITRIELQGKMDRIVSVQRQGRILRIRAMCPEVPNGIESCICWSLMPSVAAGANTIFSFLENRNNGTEEEIDKMCDLLLSLGD